MVIQKIEEGNYVAIFRRKGADNVYAFGETFAQVIDNMFFKLNVLFKTV